MVRFLRLVTLHGKWFALRFDSQGGITMTHPGVTMTHPARHFHSRSGTRRSAARAQRSEIRTPRHVWQAGNGAHIFFHDVPDISRPARHSSGHAHDKPPGFRALLARLRFDSRSLVTRRRVRLPSGLARFFVSVTAIILTRSAAHKSSNATDTRHVRSWFFGNIF